jgi:glutathione-regulated potassium-efflux system ancillary protein KefF
MLDTVRDLPSVTVRSLYDRYPDFDIDVEAEQAALIEAKLVIWMHPIYWYSVPGMLKHWFDVVLTRGWAYGNGGTALAGKSCLWVTTTGGTPETYAIDGAHRRPFDDFAAPVEQTARFCGMQWLPPLTLHGSHVISEGELSEMAATLRRRVMAWQQQNTGAAHAD